MLSQGVGDRTKADISINVGRGDFSVSPSQQQEDKGSERESAWSLAQPGQVSRACLQRLCIQWTQDSGDRVTLSHARAKSSQLVSLPHLPPNLIPGRNRGGSSFQEH